MVTIVIPVFNDAHALTRTLTACDLSGAEVIVAATAADRESLAPLRAAHPNVRWIEAPRGRARQMNAGAAAARGRWLVFLHADTSLPRAWRNAIAAADRDPRV